MRKMEDVANAETLARRDEAEHARARARHAHAAAAAARSESGNLNAFLASRQLAGALVAAAADADAAVMAADAAAAVAQEDLLAAKVRSASFDRLVYAAREQAKAALDAADIRTLEDTIAASAAGKNND